MPLTPLGMRQKAGERVERRFMEFILQYAPAGNLTLADAKQFAAVARELAWEEFSKEEETP